MTTETLEKILKVGDILVSSWGYDQTNIDFYKVVKKSESSVWLQKLGKNYLEQTGWAHYTVVPTREKLEIPFARRYKSGDYVSINRHKGAFLWDGKPRTETHTC